MSLARNVFYETVSVMRAVAQNPLLTDSAVGLSQHNVQARILRNGLIISSFSLMETYLEDRLEEKIRELSGSRIPYSSFSETLQTFLTVDAIAGMATKIGFADRSDRLQLAERHLVQTANFRAVPPIYTGLGFSPKGSNISEGDIKSLFAAFGVRDGWRRLSALCGNVGSSRLSLRDDFKNLTADVETHLATALLIGLTSDIVITHAIDCFLKKRSLAAAETAANNVSSLSVRFLDEQVGGLWIERVGINGSVIKRYADRGLGKAEARSRSRLLPIVVRNSSLVPIELL
jgi:hypothetical protein